MKFVSIREFKGKSGQVWKELAREKDLILTSNGRTLAQGALAWIWARSRNTLPIPGFRTVTQVKENCAALRFGPLTPAQMEEVERILGRVKSTDEA